MHFVKKSMQMTKQVSMHFVAVRRDGRHGVGPAENCRHSVHCLLVGVTVQACERIFARRPPNSSPPTLFFLPATRAVAPTAPPT